jgi:hypothetical protein
MGYRIADDHELLALGRSASSVKDRASGGSRCVRRDSERQYVPGSWELRLLQLPLIVGHPAPPRLRNGSHLRLEPSGHPCCANHPRRHPPWTGRCRGAAPHLPCSRVSGRSDPPPGHCVALSGCPPRMDRPRTFAFVRSRCQPGIVMRSPRRYRAGRSTMVWCCPTLSGFDVLALMGYRCSLMRATTPGILILMGTSGLLLLDLN